MQASHQQTGTLEGLSRFLVQHERCGAGFDVAHPAGLGSGRVAITCRGCGARHEYTSTTIEVEPEPGAVPTPYPDVDRRATESAADAPEVAAAVAAQGGAAAAAKRSQPGAKLAEGRGRLGSMARSRRAMLALAAVVAVALGLIVVWIVNGGSGNEGSGQSPGAPPGSPKASSGGARSAAGGPSPAAPRVKTLRTPHFSVTVPQGWKDQTSSGGLLVAPAGGGRVNVQIFFQRRPDLSRARMAQKTAAYLGGQVPGATISSRRVQIAGGPADQLTARGTDEQAIGIDVLRGPYRYLLVRRVSAGAQQRTIRAATRIVRSFSPS